MDLMYESLVKAHEAHRRPIIVNVTYPGKGTYVVAMIHAGKSGELPDIRIHQPVRNSRLTTIASVL